MTWIDGESLNKTQIDEKINKLWRVPVGLRITFYLRMYISTYLRTYIVISKCPSSSSPLKDWFFLNRVPFSILFTRWKASLKYERTCWEIGNLFLKIFHLLRMWLFSMSCQILTTSCFTIFSICPACLQEICQYETSAAAKALPANVFQKCNEKN